MQDKSKTTHRLSTVFKKADLCNLKTQYLIGFAFNLLFLLLLYSCHTSYRNVQVPTGNFKNNIWQCSDVMTYVNPAINFTKYHVFGIQNVPDHFRTIGYPAIICLFYFVFGTKWLIMLHLFQAVIFALIYPLITVTVKLIVPGSDRRLIVIVFMSLLISGAYFTRTPVVLTDTLFTLLFISGFYFGLKTYLSKNNIFLIAYLAAITFAALIRPTIGLFPVLNLAIGFFIVKKYALPLKSTLLKALYLSVTLAGLINISSVRNILNYRFFSPSSVIGNNAFNYLARKVLVSENRTDEYHAFFAESRFGNGFIGQNQTSEGDHVQDSF